MMQPYPDLLRERVFSVLAEPFRLVVMAGHRFAGKTMLIRGRLTDVEHAGPAAYIFIEQSGFGSTSEQFWTRALDKVRDTEDLDVPQVRDGAFETLCRLLTRTHRPLVLIFDGVERIDGLETGVETLLARTRSVRVIVTTRRLGAWADVAAGHFDRMILPSSMLAFTPEETSKYLNAHGVPQDLRTAEWIVGRTGGSAALVDAVRVCLQADPGRAVTRESGFGRIVDAAIDRMLARVIENDPALAARSREVVLAAVPTSLSTAAIAALPGRIDADAFRSMLESSGLLEPDVDSSGDVFGEVRRFPEPVRLSLQRLAEAWHPGAVQSVRARLIEDHLDDKDSHAALEHAIALQDWSRAAQIVTEHWTAAISSGVFFETISTDLFDRIPAPVVESDPTLRALFGLYRRFTVPRIPSITPEPSPEDEDDLEDGTGPYAVLLRSVRFRLGGQFGAAAAVWENAAPAAVPDLDDLDDITRHFYAFSELQAGNAYLLAGDLDGAIVRFRCAHRAGTETFIEREAAGKVALAHALRGDSAEARSWLDEERRHPPLSPSAEILVRPAGLIATALLALDRLDPDVALDVLTDLGNPHDWDELWALTLYVHGQYSLLTQIPSDGLCHLETHMSRFPVPVEGLPATLLAAIRADLLLALGRVEEAREAVERISGPRIAPVHARVRLHDRDADGAAELVARYRSDPGCSPRAAMELAVTAVATTYVLDGPGETRPRLRQVVRTSKATGNLRPLVLLPVSVVRAFADLGDDVPERVRVMWERSAVFPVSVSAVELTPRERVVLAGLIAGRGTAAIAKAQFVSVNTVKSQLRSLYRKLGVSSAQEAVVAARMLRIG